MTSPALCAFSAYGIELEYMIVDRAGLGVRPIADKLLRDSTGSVVNEAERGLFAWSNELVMHLVELKNVMPIADLAALARGFQGEIEELNARLASMDARLMPTGAHPWMNPEHETWLWCHDHAEIYQAYDHVFGCRQHGFANLQSMHVNLPFADDGEFSRLHAAIRLVLPILPGLAASSPIREGAPTPWRDGRMAAYKEHQRRLPASLGRIIPDTTPGIAEYRATILEPMYQEASQLDASDTLSQEWLNARGAIPRFDRNAMEIRVIDIQECPWADLAIASATVAVVQSLYRERYSELSSQQAIETETLAVILDDCIRDADAAEITDMTYLGLLGWRNGACSAGRLWRHLVESCGIEPTWEPPLQVILEHGPLAQRILKAAADCEPDRLHTVYGALCDCLAEGRMFVP